MSPAWIRRREHPPTVRRAKMLRTYQVLFRRGGRDYPIETAGTFRTEREARLRRDLVAGWLAAGHDPKAELAKLAVPAVRRTYRDVALEWQTSRIDAADETADNIRTHLAKLLPIFGEQTPDEITVADCIAAVATIAATLAPSSLRNYWGTHRQILDFAGVEPNPARHRSVKLPRIVQEETVPPSADEFLAMLDNSPRRWRLPLIFMEQTAMALGETVQLEWADVDQEGSRLRLRRATVKAQIRSRARWVQVPAWLMRRLLETVPPDDRTGVVFPGFTDHVARKAMQRACQSAGIAHYHPHDLRHRRLSLWHGQGIPARELATHAGHSKPSMSLDVYSHMMPLDEAPADVLDALAVMPR